MRQAAFRFERSSGGIVLRDGKILAVQVRNLKGEVVWTFPKGHLEKGESVEEAARREVLEETGWECEIEGGPFETARYFFKHGTALVKKEVVWFRMRPIARTGESDPAEILNLRWFPLRAALKRCPYASDRKILKRLLSED